MFKSGGLNPVRYFSKEGPSPFFHTAGCCCSGAWHQCDVGPQTRVREREAAPGPVSGGGGGGCVGEGGGAVSRGGGGGAEGGAPVAREAWPRAIQTSAMLRDVSPPPAPPRHADMQWGACGCWGGGERKGGRRRGEMVCTLQPPSLPALNQCLHRTLRCQLLPLVHVIHTNI